MDEKEKSLEEIKRLKALLEAEKQEFLSVISHELRTPISKIKGHLAMVLEGDAGEISGEAKEYVSQAYIANERLVRLIDRMFKIAELREKNFKFNFTQVDLTREIEQIVKDANPRAGEKQITLSHTIDGQIMVKGDADRVREVLLILVNNAIKYTSNGGKVTLSVRDNDESIITDVTDTGIGIAKEDQVRIFELFAKGNLSLTDQERGPGVGLYLARRLAEEQGGRVWVDRSEPGKGSTFSFSLPKA